MWQAAGARPPRCGQYRRPSPLHRTGAQRAPVRAGTGALAAFLYWLLTPINPRGFVRAPARNQDPSCWLPAPAYRA